MRPHHDLLRCPPGPRLGFLALGLLLLAGTVALAQDDPVDELQSALAIRLEDLTNPTEAVVNFRREYLQKKINNLHTIGQLRRALALEDWKPMDTGMRKLVAERFTNAIQRVIQKGEPTARMAAANLIAEIGPTIRAVDPADRAGFTRSLTKQVIELAKDPVPEVQQEALRALGNINARPRDAFPVLVDSVEHAKLGSRRQAAAAFGQMVRVVGFLQKRGRTAAGIESTRPEVIEVAEAAAAGASYGLADPDPLVRRYCLEAIDESAKATADMIPDPYSRKDFPPEGRPLSDDERKEIQATQGVVLREANELGKVFKAFQKEAPLLGRNLHAAEPAVISEAMRAVENVATARIRMIRRVISAPAVDKADETERRKLLTGLDPLAFFLEDNHLQSISRLVHAPDPRFRRTAVDILELLGEDAQRALPVLADALGDPDRFVRWASARAIGHIGPRQAPFAVPGLAKLLSDTDDNVRLAASATLEAMGAAAKDAMPALLKAIATGDAETRVAAMYILISIGAENDGPAVPALIESLGATDQRVRRAAADVLGKLGPIAAPAEAALRHALEDDDQEVRTNASEALLSILVPPLE
jgi:HEAT repeat protein